VESGYEKHPCVFYWYHMKTHPYYRPCPHVHTYDSGKYGKFFSNPLSECMYCNLSLIANDRAVYTIDLYSDDYDDFEEDGSIL